MPEDEAYRYALDATGFEGFAISELIEYLRLTKQAQDYLLQRRGLRDFLTKTPVEMLVVMKWDLRELPSSP